MGATLSPLRNLSPFPPPRNEVAKAKRGERKEEEEEGRK